jgi:hypothetical protein
MVIVVAVELSQQVGGYSVEICESQIDVYGKLILL